MGKLKDKDDEIFEGKSLSDVLEDIYKNSKERKKDIDDVMQSFMKYIKQNKDVTFIGPVIKDLIHVSVQNDEQLVKMATIVQRIMTSNGKDTEQGLLTESDKEALLKIAEKSNEPLDSSIQDTFDDIEGVMLGDENPEIEVVTDDEEEIDGGDK